MHRPHPLSASRHLPPPRTPQFRVAVGRLVPYADERVALALFDELDADGSGSLEFRELHAKLRRCVR